MKFNFKDYKKFCKENGLKEDRLASLRLFKLEVWVFNEIEKFALIEFERLVEERRVSNG